MKIHNLENIKKIHFIGIGGISMSGLAHVLINNGYRVSGSDAKLSDITDGLEKIGASITCGHYAETINDDIDLVVYTAAVKSDNPELIAAREKKIHCIERATLLGYMMQDYKYPIAVSGTHGKTTTTSMIAHVLMAAKLDPTISVGGILNSIGGNIRVGNSNYFLTEACEYTNSFLKFFPYIGVILNIDLDHVDFFHDLEDMANSFRKFAELIPEYGALVINKDTQYFEMVTKNLKCKVVTYGTSEGVDYKATNIHFTETGLPIFDVEHDDIIINSVELSVRGDHNIQNALSAMAVADFLGIDSVASKAGLKDFVGTNRRFEIKGTYNGATIVDDYAHHPTEIHATMNSVKAFPHNKLWVIFQSHTYSRTKEFLEDFAKELSFADNVVIADIYAAREQNTVGVYPSDIVNLIKQTNPNAVHISDFNNIIEYITSRVQPNDLVITMGAGELDKVAEMIVNKK